MINITPPQELTKIYLVTNCYGDPNKVYIGKEKINKTRRSRKDDHKKTYGKDIIFIYIDEVDSLYSKDWKPLECFWIEYFRQLGFDIQNKNKGGGGSNKHSDETRLKIRKPILQYDLSGNFIKEWSGACEAAIYFKAPNMCNITDCCNGRQQTAYGFVWRKKNNPLNKNFKPYTRPGKILYQYNLKGDLVKIWETAIKAALFFNKKSSGNITRCCNGELKTAHGFIWSYKNK